MSTATRQTDKEYSAHAPRYEGISSRGWLHYQEQHRIVGWRYKQVVSDRFHVIVFDIREAIVRNAGLTDEELHIKAIHQKEQRLAQVKVHFSPDTTLKGRLEPEGFKINYLLQFLLGEIAYFVSTGRIRQHTQFICQDRRP